MPNLTIPTYFTLFRLLLIPLMCIIYFSGDARHAHFWSALTFAVASATDFLDGYLARRLKQVSSFGRFLDPVADKLIVTCALVIIVYEYRSSDHTAELMAMASLIIICREMFVSALREWMAELGKSATVQVSWVGKTKTTFQMIAIGFLIWRPNQYSPLYKGWDWIEYTAQALLGIAVVLTVWSMIGYILAARAALKETPAQKERRERVEKFIQDLDAQASAETTAKQANVEASAEQAPADSATAPANSPKP